MLTRFLEPLALGVAAVGLSLGLVGQASAAEAVQPTAFSVQVTGTGKPMIFIPGLASSGAVWDSTVAHYASRYQCFVLQLAGFAGAPAKPANCNTKHW